MTISFSGSAGALALAALFASMGATVVLAQEDIGIVVYNAQHESLGVAWA